MKRDIVVVGGATYDITGRLLQTVNARDSNPSHIYMGSGGVGRNIVENAARIGLVASFITVWGTDAFSAQLEASCERVGVDTSHCYIKKETPPCVYIDFLDQHGELLLAASDLSALETQPVDWFAGAADYINQHKLLCLDANLLEDQLQAIATHCKAVMIADTVSIAKAPRIKPILPYLFAVKTNIGELGALTGRSIYSQQDIAKAGEEILATGVQKVFVTIGEKGACCMDGQRTLWMDKLTAKVKSVSGAGDAFCAGIAYGILRGLSSADTLLFSTAMSHITLQSPTTVSEGMSEQRVIQLKEKLHTYLM